MALRNDIVMVLLLLVSDESGKLVGTHRKSHPFMPGEITFMISDDRTSPFVLASARALRGIR